MLDSDRFDGDFPRGAGGAQPSPWERGLTAGLVLTLAVAALAYAPAVPYPAALQRHAAALAGVGVCGLVAARALSGRGFLLTPLPAATLAMAGALTFTAAIPLDFAFIYSKGSAVAVAAAAVGLCILAAAARGASVAGLASRLLWSAAVLGAAVSILCILEALGLDPLRAAPFYNSQQNPVATFGNSNPLVNFLTPCASLACALGLASRGAKRAAAFVCAALGAAAVGLAGVHYGIAALTMGLTVALALTVRRIRKTRGDALTNRKLLWGAPAALLVLGLGMHILRDLDAQAPPVASAPIAAASAFAPRWPIPETLEVRARIWLATLRQGLAFAPWGAGAGNFAISFPSFRDPREIELSTHNRLDTAESTVDHAHNDPIQFCVEAGVPGLVALGAFVVGLWRWRRRGVYSASPEAVAASAGLAAIAVAALAHAPLYGTAASAILTAILFGIVGSGGDAELSIDASSSVAPAVLGRPLGVVLLCALPIPTLLAFWALQSDVLLTLERVDPGSDLGRLRRASELAPDDVHPPLELARRLRAAGDRAGALDANNEARRRQPFLIEPLMNCGVLLAEGGDFEGANAAFRQCEILDPRHPSLRQNRMQLLIHRAEAERRVKRDREASELLSQAVALGAAEVLLRQWGNFFYEAKDYARAIPYLDRYATRQPLDAENWHRMGMAFQKLGGLEAASLDFAKAHHLFALEHVRADRLDAAARSSKQYLRWAGPQEAGPFVLEALIAYRQKDGVAVKLALGKAEAGGLSLDAAALSAAEYSDLLQDPEFGPRLRALVK